MITQDTFGDCIIAQDDDNDYDESGWIALVDGDEAYLASYSHCSCFGTWTALRGESYDYDNALDRNGLPANWYVWTGTRKELIELAKRKADPAVPDREAQVGDCDYDHLMKVYEMILKNCANVCPEAFVKESPMTAELQNKEYVLTIRVKIGAFDDVEARRLAHDVLACDCRMPNDETKLQEVFKDKAPRKVEL